MSLIEDAINDAAEITGDDTEFGVNILLQSDNEISCEVVGLKTKHHLGMDAMGNRINTKKASVTISEKNIYAANPDYPVRNSNPSSRIYQEVEMIGHRVDVIDSTGIVKKYKVAETYPDESLGLIVLILEDWEDA